MDRSKRKQELRRQVKAELGYFDFKKEAEAVWERLFSFSFWETSRHILLYQPIDLEFPSHRLIQRAIMSQKQAYLPVSDQVAHYPILCVEPLIAGLSKTDDFAAIDLAIIPGLTFDYRGYRLGRGGGYYDRLIPLLSSQCITIGVIPAFAICETLRDCLEEWDSPLKYLLTEQGLYVSRSSS